MRNALVILTAFCVGGALVACNSKSNNANPSNNSPSTNTPVVTPPAPPTPITDKVGTLEWTLKFQTKCPESIAAAECLGVYGFAVQTNGDYTVGPDQKGQIRSGKLSEEEKNSVVAALNSSLSQASSRSESHETLGLEEPNENEVTVSLVQGTNAPENLVKTAGNDFYFRTQTLDEAKTLLSAISKLADKYAKDFPDDCVDGANSLQTLFAEAQKCTTDADCVFLRDFETVASNSSEDLITDDCSILKPLVAGNAEFVRLNQSKLVAGLDGVREACTNDRIMRDNCVEVTNFTLSGAGPTCQAGMCKLPSQ